MRIQELLDVMARLRDPERGCPWDVEQTFRTIAPHTIEEAYEVADAIEREDLEHLKDELGDLLFQVVFYAQMAKEAGAFDFADIVAGITDKMIRRHPHVFGQSRVETAEAQTEAWEELKAREREQKAGARRPGPLDGVPPTLPAMTRALKLQKRAARVGFDWPDAGPVLDKVAEETEEICAEMRNGGAPERLDAEIGDLLFTCVNLARKLGVEPEGALRRCNARFERRFRAVEDGLARKGKSVEDASLEEMDALWEQAKTNE